MALDAFYARDKKPAGAIRIRRALDAHLIAKPNDPYRVTRGYLEDASRLGVR
jgi:hypothetical protein